MRSCGRIIVTSLVALALAFGVSTAGSAPLFTVVDGYYKLPASVDPSVTSLMKTELWAHVWRPNAGGP